MTFMMKKGEEKSTIQIPYMIMMLICLAGSVATSFLPETLGAKLPETLEASFGTTYLEHKSNL